MMTRLRHWWQATRTSFWFIPAIIVVAAVGLATAVIAVDATVDLHVVDRWPLLFGAGAAGARGLLTAVAGSMITVAGVVFSITIVALALTSSQYTSRILPNLMRDIGNQAVLGVFVGIFAYCLVVLRTIRSGDEGAFVPSLAVLVGLLLAFVGIAFLIYFIHHISITIQASTIVATAAQETIAAVDHLFPAELGDDADDDLAGDVEKCLAEQPWSPVPASTTGYIQSVAGEALLSVARKRQVVLRMERGIGEFVVEGTPLASVSGPDSVDEETTALINDAYIISRQRSVEQDAAFGIREIVDIALKALSPGINDTTTAVMCVDYLAAILIRVTPRRMATPHRLDDGQLRVIARGPTFETLVADAFDQVRESAKGNVAIMLRLLGALQTIAALTGKPSRRQALREQMHGIVELAHRTIDSSHDRARFERRLARWREAFEAPAFGPRGTSG